MIREVTMYQAQCDRCGRIEDDYGECVAWSEAEHAIDLALDTNDWHKVGDRLLCLDCVMWTDEHDDLVEKPPVGEPAS